MKSTGVTYILWLLLGGIGAHKFYLNKAGMGILYITLGALGGIFWIFLLGWIFHIPLGILLIIDLFTIPRQVRNANEKAAGDVARFEKMVEAKKME
ncbi:MAG: TM2 domain-containing protein [Spirochaetota bacterium]